MNHDGVVNVTDVTTLISSVLGAGTEVCEICADFNGDGVVNITDVTLLISMLMNND